MSHETLEAELRKLENWNHEQALDQHADAGSFYEAGVYARGAECYELARWHRAASAAIEMALASPPAVPMGLIEELKRLEQDMRRHITPVNGVRAWAIPLTIETWADRLAALSTRG